MGLEWSNLCWLRLRAFFFGILRKAEEEAKKAAEATKKVGEKGIEDAKKVGGKAKDVGEKGVEETRKAAHKVKEKID